MQHSLVFMGVAGCGKSTLAAAVAADHGLPLVEGDDFHSAASRDKMARGVALTDADRDGWLTLLGAKLASAGPTGRSAAAGTAAAGATSPHQGCVLTCSALKRAYRDRLRAAAPGVRFVFLDIPRDAALARVAGRGAHFFSASLVDDQFNTLESPVGEPGVLRVDALAPLAQLQAEVSRWLNAAPLTT